MLDATLGKSTAVTPQAAASGAALDKPAQEIIQCRQCSEHFVKSTVVCPRCNRWNDRSPLTLALRIFVAVVFVAVISWTAWAVTKIEDPPRMDGALKPLPKASSGSAGSPDLRF